MPALVRNAEIFGTKLIRAFAGWRYRDIPVMWPQILDFFKQALEAVPEDIVLVDFPSLFGSLGLWGAEVPLDLEPHRAAEGQQLDEAMRATPGGQGYGNPDNATEDLAIIREMLKRL